ncbi:hypothetical protein LJC53_07455 [Bacteroidales bacterium OttesenSCG-928-C03]|nr:hypothetical protein [Bacteroidales bacterium OttesenSCG-928-C03]
MKFHGIRGQKVELKIVNYEFPDKNNDEWDDNWLNIYLNVTSEVGNWQTVDPSLTTCEVGELINWFETFLQREKPVLRELSFMEPNLSFELLDCKSDGLTMFRIKFDLESRPKSATDDREYFVDCLVDDQELKQIVENLKTELEKFLER